MVEVVEVDAAGTRARLDALAAVLVDAVESGASVGFLPPFAAAQARSFWEAVAADVEAGRRRLAQKKMV
jgi:hypothetical protein